MASGARRGEKLGWLIGWSGGFVWLLALAVVWLVEGRVWVAAAGILLWLAAELFVVRFTPWRYPGTRYFWLMLPLYLILIAATVLVMVGFGKKELSARDWSSFAWILPMLTPLFILGRRRWDG